MCILLPGMVFSIEALSTVVRTLELLVLYLVTMNLCTKAPYCSCKTLLRFLYAFSFSSKYCFSVNSCSISFCLFLLNTFCFSDNSFENFLVPFPSQANFLSQQIPSKIPLCFSLLKQILLFSKFLLKFVRA